MGRLEEKRHDEVKNDILTQNCENDGNIAKIDLLDDQELMTYLQNNEKLYLNFDFNQIEELPITSELNQNSWGKYNAKPNSQVEWDKSLKEVAAAIVNNEVQWEMSTLRNPFRGTDIRPRAFDQISKEHLLIDSGAQISVWPRSRFPEAKLDPYVSIQAVNKSKIETFGKKEIAVRFGRKQYNHTVIIADVDQPVLGWDFCKKISPITTMDMAG